MSTTRTLPQPVSMTADDLLNPGSRPLAVAPANGGQPRRMSSRSDVDDKVIDQTILEAGVRSLLQQEQQLEYRLEMFAALRRTLQVAQAANAEPDQLRAVLRATAGARAKAAAQSHAAVLAQVKTLTHEEHTLVRHHDSFLKEAGIGAADSATRGRVKLLLSPGSLTNHPGFGTQFCAPIAGRLVIHEGVFGMLVTAEPIRSAHQLVEVGRTCGKHSALMFAPFPTNRLESLDQILLDKDGEENVVLVCCPINSTADVVLEGSFALAGKFFRDMTAGGGFGSNVTGLDSRAALSDAYLTPPLPPFVDDFRDRADQMPGGVVVGASGTDPVSMDRVVYTFHGIHVARARRKEPAYQISVRLAYNYLRRVLKVAGHLLLPLPPTARADGVRKLEFQLRTHLVGPLPRMFRSLILVIDRDSPEGKQALQEGGLLLKVVVELNTRTESVSFTIVQPIDGPDQPVR